MDTSSKKRRVYLIGIALKYYHSSRVSVGAPLQTIVRTMRDVRHIVLALSLVLSASAFLPQDAPRRPSKLAFTVSKIPARAIVSVASSASTAATAQESSSAPTQGSASLTLFSPCKINLFLRILRKRDDGYHDLASLFQAIGFGDTLELTLLPEQDDNDDTPPADQFTCNMPGVPVDATNLVLRALALMREKTGMQRYFAANLIKQVPAQAGLGGGSANAATAMWGANHLLGNPASLEEVRRKSFKRRMSVDES